MVLYQRYSLWSLSLANPVTGLNFCHDSIHSRVASHLSVTLTFVVIPVQPVVLSLLLCVLVSCLVCYLLRALALEYQQDRRRTEAVLGNLRFVWRRQRFTRYGRSFGRSVSRLLCHVGLPSTHTQDWWWRGKLGVRL